MTPRPSTDKPREHREPEPHAIEVDVDARFVGEQSKPEANRYVFAYEITLRNLGMLPARLQPGESYSYSSGAVLETQVGTMRGTYLFHADDGSDFEVPIPEFVLSVPRTLH
jgi:ApaG protein